MMKGEERWQRRESLKPETQGETRQENGDMEVRPEGAHYAKCKVRSIQIIKKDLKESKKGLEKWRGDPRVAQWFSACLRLRA